MSRYKLKIIRRPRNKNDIINLSKEIDDCIKQKRSVWITGPSGAGKSYLGKELAKKYQICELDNYGYVKEVKDKQTDILKWFLKYEKVPKNKDIYIGLFDNDSKLFREQNRIGLVIVLFASYNEYRKAWNEKAKNADNRFKEGHLWWANEATDPEIQLMEKSFINEYVRG